MWSVVFTGAMRSEEGKVIVRQVTPAIRYEWKDFHAADPEFGIGSAMALRAPAGRDDGSGVEVS